VLSKNGIGQGVAAAFGVVLAAVYMLSVVQKMFFGPITNDKNRGLNDLNVRETLALAPFVVLIFVIGFFPHLFLSRTEASANAVIDRFRNGRMAYQDVGPNTREASLQPRRGGPYERGYPEKPGAEPAAEPSLEAANAAAPGGEK
jgi:NADH-quinone oxidoreductase subunit M